jgi:hypothetical protein
MGTADGDIGGIDCAGENGVDIILVGAGGLVREIPSPRPSPYVPVGDPEPAPWTSSSPPGAGDAPRSKKAMLAHAERGRGCRYRFDGRGRPGLLLAWVGTRARVERPDACRRRWSRTYGDTGLSRVIVGHGRDTGDRRNATD